MTDSQPTNGRAGDALAALRGGRRGLPDYWYPVAFSRDLGRPASRSNCSASR